VEPLSGQEYKVTGNLTMHGVTKSITFEAEYSGQSSMMVGLTAKTKINRKDFDFSYGAVVEADQVALSEIVTIEIDLETVQQSTAS
jgi:polyisoprenoid-binding protein YceI